MYRLPKRHIHTRSPLMNLFGGGGRPTSMRPHPEHILRPPQNKSQAPANPADILKKNDILMYSTKPMNYIESVKENGFHLSNNFLITSPRKNDNNAIVGLLLLHSETFEVDLKTSKDDSTLVIENDWYVKLGDDVLNVFKLVHPKPEILVIGLGKKSRMLSIENRDFFSKLGIQLEISDSNNAAQIFDLLATERPNVIGALLLPPNL